MGTRSTAVRRLVAVAISTGLAVLAACSGEDTPTGPSTPDEPQLQSVEVDPDSTELVPGEKAEFEGAALDAQGDTLSGVDLTWSSTDTAVATVDTDGSVTAVDVGSAGIVASAEGEADTAAVEVTESQLEEEAVVVDSSQTRLVSDSAERDRGVYKFVARTGSPPEVEAGEIIIGNEDLGFLRRVNSTQTRGDTLVLETEQASLSEAVEAGSFQTTVQITPGQSQARRLVRRGDVRWGRTRVLRSAKGVTASSGGLDLDNVVLASTGGGVTLTVESGRIGFAPEVDAGVDLGLTGLEEFHAIGESSLTFNLALALEAAAPLAEQTFDQTLIEFGKPFYATVAGAPVAGELQLRFVAGTDLEIGAATTLTGGVEGQQSLRVGARFRGDRWSGVFEPTESFRSRPVQWDAGGGASARIFVRPVVRIEFWKVAGPSLDVDPHLGVSGQVNSTEWTLEMLAGLDAGLGFDITIFDREIARFEKRFEGPEATLFQDSGGIPDRLRIEPSDPPELAINQTQDFEAVPVDQNGDPVSLPGTPTWTSSDPSVAEIDGNGVATALAAGETEIDADFPGLPTESSVTLSVIDVEAQPSASTTESSMGVDSPDQGEAEFCVAVSDVDGEPVQELTASDFDVPDVSTGGGTLSFTPSTVSPGPSLGSGSFSATLVIDQSGSMSSTDPSDARIAAAKQFAQEMIAGDQTAVFSFDTGVRQETGFTASSGDVADAVEALGSPSGSTALYDAGIEACRFTASNAANGNQAVVLLTDGQDNESSNTVSDLVDECNSLGVKVSTVGFASALPEVLARIAAEANGVVIHDTDVDVLLSGVRSLPDLLRGDVESQCVNFDVAASGLDLTQGGTADGRINVDLSGATSSSGDFVVSFVGSTTGTQNTVSAPFFLEWSATR